MTHYTDDDARAIVARLEAAGARQSAETKAAVQRDPKPSTTPQRGAQPATGASDGVVEPSARRLIVRGLPCPPSLNNAYINAPGKGRVLTKDARTYKAAAHLSIASAAQQAGFTVPPRTFVRLSFRFWFANPARDGSNAVKLIEDAIAAALGFDDRWVVGQGWDKYLDADRPRCDVEIEVL